MAKRLDLVPSPAGRQQRSTDHHDDEHGSRVAFAQPEQAAEESDHAGDDQDQPLRAVQHDLTAECIRWVLIRGGMERNARRSGSWQP